MIAKRLKTAKRDAPHEEVASGQLRKGDFVLVTAGELIPGDGEIVDGVASVDESAITGESASATSLPAADNTCWGVLPLAAKVSVPEAASAPSPATMNV